MIPYSYGFGPEDIQVVDLQIDLMKKLGRNCKAFVKKARRSASRRLRKR